MILEMGEEDVPIILGRPFLSTKYGRQSIEGYAHGSR
jgi:hypothetical protein